MTKINNRCMVVSGVSLVHGSSLWEYCKITRKIVSCENHSEREDMTTFILEYTRKELHCQDKWDTFLILMQAFGSVTV